MAYASVIFSILGAINLVILIVMNNSARPPAGCTFYSQLQNLNSTCIEFSFKRNSDMRVPNLFNSFFDSMVYVMIIPGFRCLGAVYGNRHAMAEVMTFCTQFAAVLAVVFILFNAGISDVNTWLYRNSSKWNDGDWRSIFIATRIISGSMVRFFNPG